MLIKCTDNCIPCGWWLVIIEGNYWRKIRINSYMQWKKKRFKSGGLKKIRSIITWKAPNESLSALERLGGGFLLLLSDKRWCGRRKNPPSFVVCAIADKANKRTDTAVYIKESHARKYSRNVSKPLLGVAVCLKSISCTINHKKKENGCSDFIFTWLILIEAAVEMVLTGSFIKKARGSLS